MAYWNTSKYIAVLCTVCQCSLATFFFSIYLLALFTTSQSSCTHVLVNYCAIVIVDAIHDGRHRCATSVRYAPQTKLVIKSRLFAGMAWPQAASSILVAQWMV